MCCFWRVAGEGAPDEMSRKIISGSCALYRSSGIPGIATSLFGQHIEPHPGSRGAAHIVLLVIPMAKSTLPFFAGRERSQGGKISPLTIATTDSSVKSSLS